MQRRWHCQWLFVNDSVIAVLALWNEAGLYPKAIIFSVFKKFLSSLQLGLLWILLESP